MARLTGGPGVEIDVEKNLNTDTSMILSPTKSNLMTDYKETDLIRRQTLALTRRLTQVFEVIAAKTNAPITNLVIAIGVGFLMACALNPSKIVDAVLIVQLVLAPLPKPLKYARWLVFIALFSTGLLMKVEYMLVFMLLHVVSKVDFVSAWQVVKGAKGIMI
jgi:hypothetical protein